MKITIYGSGYVGLVTSACLAQAGNEILCIDINEKKINKILKGDVSIHEPGLNQMLEENILAGRLKFSTSAQEGVEHGLYQFIAVGTPRNEDQSPNIDNVLDVAKSIATHMNGYRVIIEKSTVPVGTADKIKTIIKDKLIERGEKHEFDIVSNPEFLKEGAAIEDFQKPDRIIIGTDNPRTAELMRELYTPFNRSRDRVVAMDIRSAELTKFAASALLATKISFMNELSNMADILGADIEQVRIGIGSDPRIGYHFIYPGCGYGGSSFPKDIQALKHTAKEIGYEAELLSAVEAINYRQKEKPFKKLMHHFENDLKGKTIALWGLAFKPNTDDMHEASSRALMEALWKSGASVRAYDPVAHDECKRIYGKQQGLTLCESKESTLEGADALAIVTEWQEFRSPDFQMIKDQLSQAIIVDGRNLYNPEHMKELGISYYAIGRGD
ncbi:MAG: UDP-glucose/GDP-mannose dehydrogenase family protein [Cocleimonas sp.]